MYGIISPNFSYNYIHSSSEGKQLLRYVFCIIIYTHSWLLFVTSIISDFSMSTLRYPWDLWIIIFYTRTCNKDANTIWSLTTWNDINRIPKTFRREVWVVKDLYFAMLLRLYRHWRLKFLEQMIKNVWIRL